MIALHGFVSTARYSSSRNSLRGIHPSIHPVDILHIAVLPPALMVFFKDQSYTKTHRCQYEEQHEENFVISGGAISSSHLQYFRSYLSSEKGVTMDHIPKRTVVENLAYLDKGRVQLPNRMNVWENSKRPLTPPPSCLENYVYNG